MTNMRSLFRRLQAFISFVAAMMASGCGSIAVQTMPAEEIGYDGPAIYGGTIYDVRGVAQAGSSGDESTIGVLLILDVPFSLLLDTILLPLTIYEQISGDWPLRRQAEGETSPQSATPVAGGATPANS